LMAKSTDTAAIAAWTRKMLGGFSNPRAS